MVSLNKPMITGLLLGIMLTAVNPVYADAKTDITASIVDGVCDISFSDTSIVFDTRQSTSFASGTAQMLPLKVFLDCQGMTDVAPTFRVSGDSSGMSDTNLFRSASSTASNAGFMLKKGELNNLADFYNAAGTVAPGTEIIFDKNEGTATEPFTVGLVADQGQPPVGAGTVEAKITFAFVFP